MRVAILDDYQRVALASTDWPDAEITVFTEHIARTETLVRALEPFDVIVAMRERTPFTAERLSSLPNLKLLVTTGMSNASIDLDAERAEEAHAELVSKEELFSRSDVVTVHYKLGPRSIGLVGAAEFSRMKRTAYLINTSRGPVVDEAPLVAALRSGTIAGAGLDVYDTEPLPLAHPLRRLPNVVLTPHLGYVTDDTYAVFYREAAEDIAAFARGEPVRVLNSGVLNSGS